MADITNPQAVDFCNTKVRTLADAYAQLYWASKAVVEAWTAQNIEALIPNDGSVIIDGSATDGRSIITGAMVNTFATSVVALTDDLEANTNAKLDTLHQIAVNPVRR